MKTARFIVGLLADRLRERAAESRKIEKRWRERSAELVSELPEPAERTPEQWEKLVEMTGELYYAIAAASSSDYAARNAEALLASLDEEAARGR